MLQRNIRGNNVKIVSRVLKTMVKLPNYNLSCKTRGQLKDLGNTISKREIWFNNRIKINRIKLQKFALQHCKYLRFKVD